MGSPDLEVDLAHGQEELSELLAAALVLEGSEEVRLRIGTMLGSPLYAVSLGHGGPYLVVKGNAPCEALMGGPPPRVEKVVELMELTTTPSFIETYRAAYEPALLAAKHAMSTLAVGADGVSARAFDEVARWAPILGVRAYRQSVLIQLALDQMRRRLLDAPSVPSLRRYWERVHLLSHLTLLGVLPEPRGWLSELAQSFSWQNWTPSFPLVRERMLRLAVRGAWASARFGASLAEPYLKTLEAGPLLRAFDGVLGLVSIALLSRQECRPIHRAIAKAITRRRRARVEDSIVMDALLRSADCALERPEEAAGRTSLRGHARAQDAEPVGVRPPFDAIDDDIDAAEIDEDGFCPAILAMGTFAPAPAGALFRDHTGPIEWTPERALNALKRTLGPRNTPATSPLWN